MLLSDCSVVRDTQLRTVVERKTMETPPTVATLLSTATRYVLMFNTLLMQLLTLTLKYTNTYSKAKIYLNKQRRGQTPETLQAISCRDGLIWVFSGAILIISNVYGDH